METGKQDNSTRFPGLSHPLRLAATIAICVMLGAITTVVVTWGLAVFLPFESVKSSTAFRTAKFGGTELKAGFMVFRYQRSGYLAVHPMTPVPVAHGNPEDHESEPSTRDLTPDWARGSVEAYWSKYRVNSIVLESFGWPCPAAFSQVSFTFSPGVSPSPTVDDGSGFIVQRVTRTRPVFNVAYPAVLPVRPIWRGLAIDVTAYAATWMLILVGLGVAKRAIRIHRGLCPRCAYNLKDQPTPGCPECGWNRQPQGASA